MRLLRLFFYIVTSTLVGWTSAASAACFTVAVVSGPITVSYNPLDSTDATATVTLELRNVSCGNGASGLIGVSNVPVTSTGSLVGSPSQLSYTAKLSYDSSHVVAFNISNAKDRFDPSTITLNNGSSFDSTWTVDIAANSVIPYGQRTFTAYIAGAINNSYTYIPVTVTVSVAQVTQLSFAGAATTLTMDFGELSSNASQNINVMAQATVPFDITWTSQNNGVLKNLGDSTWSVPYTATLNGTTVNNSTIYTDLTNGGTQGASVSLPVVVTVGNATNKKAGTYQDIVTIKIAPH